MNNQENKNVRLQYFGTLEGTPAGEISKGDIICFNFGSRATVTEINKKTEKSIWVSMETESGNIYEKRYLKNRLVVLNK